MGIEGINPVRSILADGTVLWRYYAWKGKGAPCFWTSPHKPVKRPFPRAFIEAWQAERAKRHEVRDDFHGMATRYLESPGFAKLSDATKALYRPLIDEARQEFSGAGLRIIGDPRFRADLIAYRDRLAATPRKADHAIQAVSVVLEHARNLGLLAANPAAGIPSLYRPPGDKRPWTDAEITQFLDSCPEYLSDAFWLIFHLALRRRDAAAIEWSADKGTHVAWSTSKSRGKREAIIPVLPAARTFLDDLRRRNTIKLTRLTEGYARKHKDVTPLQTASRFMLVAHRGQAWRDEASITKAFAKRWADILDPKGERRAAGETLDFPSPHRLRNNAATAYLVAGLDERTIADAMGWSLADVEEMRRVYVDREAVVSAAIIRLGDRK